MEPVAFTRTLLKATNSKTHPVKDANISGEDSRPWKPYPV